MLPTMLLYTQHTQRRNTQYEYKLTNTDGGGEGRGRNSEGV